MTGGVGVDLLRPGHEPLFVVPGLEGDATELAGLVAAFTGPQAVYALVPLLTDAAGQPVTTIERMAELMEPVVREVAPSGPYRLAGYSFGALVARELARRLGEVEAVFLIEAVYDERFWPRRTWLAAVTRRTGWHLARIARLPPRQACAELRLRGTRLVRRVARRRVGAPDRLPPAADTTAMSERGHAAMARYRPRFLTGEAATLITGTLDRHFGCDVAALWARLIDRLYVQRVVGDHLTILDDPTSAAAVARIIDHQLARRRCGWPGLRPVPGFEHPMILTTMRWFSAARLAQALTEAGFAVSACRPRGHALGRVDGLTLDRRLPRLRPIPAIAAAIRAVGPDLVIADDEHALTLLRRLHERVRTTEPDLADLLARSVGAVEDWPALISRTRLADEARALALTVPDTAVVADRRDLDAWADVRELPLVLKTDGSWGGCGVTVVRERPDLSRAWRRISAPPGLARALKRAAIDHELASLSAWLRREHPVVNAQQYCSGQEAIVTAACVDGKVQSLVALEVVRASAPFGPAAVVRIIEHPGLADAATQLIRRFRLSGFLGFDFVLTADGRAHLLELNPRATPTCHLLVEREARPGQVLALFPCEHARGLDPDLVDVPMRAPVLAERGRRWAARRGRPVPRAVRRLKRALRRDLHTPPGPLS